MGILDYFFGEPEPTPCDDFKVTRAYGSNGPRVEAELPKIRQEIDGRNQWVMRPDHLSISVRNDSRHKTSSYFSGKFGDDVKDGGGRISLHYDRNNGDEIAIVNTHNEVLESHQAQRKMLGRAVGVNAIIGGYVTSRVKDGEFTNHDYRPTVFSSMPIGDSQPVIDAMQQAKDTIAAHPKLAELQACMDYTLENGRYKNYDFVDHRQHLPKTQELIDAAQAAEK